MNQLNNQPEKTPANKQYFNTLWNFMRDPHCSPSVALDSIPVIDDEKIYFSSGDGIFLALNQITGSIVWKFKTRHLGSKVGTFSSLILHDKRVYLGACDKNIYCLDAETGKIIWVSLEADWVGSAMAIDPKLGLLFTVLESGILKKQETIVALDIKTGERKWAQAIRASAISALSYVVEKQSVIVGNNDGTIYAFAAHSGEKKWTCGLDAEIKGPIIFDADRSWIFINSTQGKVYAVDVDRGGITFSSKGDGKIYFSPCPYNDDIVYSCSDEHIYCINLTTNEIRWKFTVMGAIFSQPILIDGAIFVVTRDNILYEIDAETGHRKSQFQATEPMEGKIAYNPASKRFFVSTRNGGLFCMSRQTSVHFFYNV